jgi:hypothetical protein
MHRWVERIAGDSDRLTPRLSSEAGKIALPRQNRDAADANSADPFFRSIEAMPTGRIGVDSELAAERFGDLRSAS